MNVQKFKQMADDPKYVEGIFNYCDRWCERCPFTGRCLNFAMGQEFLPDQEQHDIQSAEFWEGLKSAFQLTRQMVEETAREQGIDLNDPKVREQMTRDDQEERRRDKAVRYHVLTKAGRKYIKLVEGWLKGSAAAIKRKQRELVSKARMELPGHDPEAEAVSIKDAMDIVRWYQFQTTVKTMRALSGVERDAELERMFKEEGEPFQRDSDGSAKVALIGMDRSLTAWGLLHEHFADDQDMILDILVHLDRLRRSLEKHFPKARSFIRPGFDTEEQ